MHLKKCIVLISIVFMGGCGGGSSTNDNKELCRNYATKSMTDSGVTQTCEFNRDTFILSCSSDDGASNSKEYPSIEDFVLESKTLGLFKLTRSVFDDIIEENYVYEANQLVSVNIDFSKIFGPESYLTITHDAFDSFNRPISGITSSNLGSECNGASVSLNYSEADNKVNIQTTGSCPFFMGNESVFDNDGNLIKNTIAGMTTEYTVSTTDEVCF